MDLTRDRTETAIFDTFNAKFTLDEKKVFCYILGLLTSNNFLDRDEDDVTVNSPSFPRSTYTLNSLLDHFKQKYSLTFRKDNFQRIMPQLFAKEDFIFDYLRGYYNIHTFPKYSTPALNIYFESSEFLQKVIRAINGRLGEIPYEMDKNRLSYTGEYAVSFLKLLYIYCVAALTDDLEAYKELNHC